MEWRYDAIILGAGAAGLMCAIEAGKRGRRVLVLERAERFGKKILISGGGRCNFTNLNTSADNFLSANPHFAKSALARYRPSDFVNLVERHRIPYHEKKLGQLFCDRSAHDITTMLEQECRQANVTIRTNCRITEVRKADEFTVTTEEATFRSARLVVASGGLSVPKAGATSFGYDLAKQFALRIQPPRPALVPIIFGEQDRERWCDLAGVATEVIASVASARQTFRERMLITHRGLSGPAILQISSYWNGMEPILLDLAPGCDLAGTFHEKGKSRSSEWRSLLRETLPNRLADRWLDVHPVAGNSDRAFSEAERHLHTWQVIPAGTEGLAKAEVTAGGVDTGELSAKTMECLKVPGLFFIGEVVDVTGQLGGFNFQWAWSSGYCAGQAL